MREGKFVRKSKRSRRTKNHVVCDGCCNTCRHCYDYCGGICGRKIAKQHDNFVLKERLIEVLEKQDLAA